MACLAYRGLFGLLGSLEGIDGFDDWWGGCLFDRL